MNLRSTDITLTAMNAALYASIGLVVYFLLPVLTPTVGGVRFWPVVIIPATFALLFGPFVGGVGAAIGIFISDVLIHGDPFLSLTVGVPANLVAFGLIGYLAQKKLSWKKTFVGLGTGVAILATLAYLVITPQNVIAYFGVTLDQAFWSILVVLIVFIVSYLIVVITGLVWPKWRSYGAAAVVGAVCGSAIIGVGIWAYTQFFSLPAAIGGAHNLPYFAGLILFAWTFATEIPFMVLIVPPIAEACYLAFPSLKFYKKELDKK
ncbi:MAG: hypothetical protein NWE98_10945 [Candidatus Bathyarchaeota archaeon]|nr:hypothetical protein [Candidatus Bathyarchaeota archaeon]